MCVTQRILHTDYYLVAFIQLYTSFPTLLSTSLFACLGIFATHLHIECVIILDGWHDTLDKLQEDEHVLLHLRSATHFLERLNDVQHGRAVLTRMDGRCE